MVEVWSERELIFSTFQNSLTVKMSKNKRWLFEICLYLWSLWTAASSVNEKLCVKLCVAFLINNVKLLWGFFFVGFFFWTLECQSVILPESVVWKINKTFNNHKRRDVQLLKQRNGRWKRESNLVKFEVTREGNDNVGMLTCTKWNAGVLWV